MIYYWISVLSLLSLVLFFDYKYRLLRDDTQQIGKHAYSFARVQLAWWMIIVISGFITAIFVTGHIPALRDSTLILLGITGGTYAAARVVDVSDRQKMVEGKLSDMHQDQNGKGFLVDILSDQNGVSLHRLQSLLFNLSIGIWFIMETREALLKFPKVCSTMNVASDASCSETLYYLMPDINANNLVLLGLSAGIYTALKSSENVKQ